MRKLVLYFLIIVFTLVCTVPAFADKLKETQQQKTTVDKKLQQLNQEKKQVINERNKLENEQKKLLDSENKESQEYNALVEELTLLNQELDKIESTLEAAEKEYADKVETMKTRLRVMYENSNDSVLDILLQCRTITEFMEKFELISLVSKRDNDLVKEIESAKKDIEYKRQLVATERMETESEVRKKQDNLNSIKASRADLENEIRKKRDALSKLEKEEDKLIKESKQLESTIKNLQSKGQYAGGTMSWPLPSNMTVNSGSGFGNRLHPIYKTWKMHTGIDIGAKHGASIVAANSGTVILAKNQSSGYGNYIVIDHGGGITTLYAHCSKLLVGVGKSVKAGQLIAYAGSTGVSTGPHLHFEVRKNGTPVDPLKGYLRK